MSNKCYSIGKLAIPCEAIYGIHTLWTLDNFPGEAAGTTLHIAELIKRDDAAIANNVYDAATKKPAFVEILKQKNFLTEKGFYNLFANEMGDKNEKHF